MYNLIPLNAISPIRQLGGKRQLRPIIAEYLPSGVHNIYEPFGGALNLAPVWDIYHAEPIYAFKGSVIMSDYNRHMVKVWRAIKDTPQILLGVYDQWKKVLQQNPKEYFNLRLLFNENQDDDAAAYWFFVLMRFSNNGLVRFNKRGWFNSSVHYKRVGSTTDKVEKMLDYWHGFLNRPNVFISHADYFETLYDIEDNDLVFLDPPYKGDSMYTESMDYCRFWFYVRELSKRNVWVMLTIGKTDVPQDITDSAYVISMKQRQPAYHFNNVRDGKADKKAPDDKLLLLGNNWQGHYLVKSLASQEKTVV